MQFNPTQSELNSLADMDGTERLQYFLTRTVEAEEVWALSDDEGWILQEEDGQTVLQVWPYEQLASDCIVNTCTCQPGATSLDHFVYTLLDRMIDEDINLEILPIKRKSGIRLTASKLNELYESLLEAGDYYLEG